VSEEGLAVSWIGTGLSREFAVAWERFFELDFVFGVGVGGWSRC